MTNQTELRQNNQELEILNWLKNNAPEVFKDQKHLDEGTSERAYWHYGRWSALKDTRTSPTPPSSAGEREHKSGCEIQFDAPCNCKEDVSEYIDQVASADDA